MKSANTIRHKLQQAIFRHRKKRLQMVLEETPSNCIHNGTILLPDGEEVGVCRFAWESSKWPGICDEQHDGLEQARICPHFTARSKKDQVKEEFREFFSTASLAEIAREYPDVAALMWVLGDEDIPTRDVEIPENEDWDTHPKPNRPSLHVQGVRVYLDSDEDRERLAETFDAVDAAVEHARLMVSVNESLKAGSEPSPKDVEAVRNPESVESDRPGFWNVLLSWWSR